MSFRESWRTYEDAMSHAIHVAEKHYTYERVKSHVKLRMKHVPYERVFRESCHTYEHDASRISMRRVPYEWVMSHRNESFAKLCHVHKYITSHISMCHVPYRCDMSHRNEFFVIHAKHMNTSRHTCACVMSHVNMHPIWYAIGMSFLWVDLQKWPIKETLFCKRDL